MTRPTDISPFPFQVRAVKKARQLLRTDKKTLVVSPPGSGKTVMIAMTVRAALRERQKILVVSHRREILTQAYEHLQYMGVREHNIGVIRGSAPAELVRPDAPIQIASISALLARDARPTADLVIVDEAHHILADGYMRLLGHYRSAQHLGYTASPHRLDGRGLGDFYDAMVIATQPSSLIKKHLLLAEPVIFTAKDEFVPDLKAVRIARGDYVVADLEKAVMKAPLIGHVPENWIKHARGWKTLGFAVSIEHSKSLVARFLARGIRAAHIDGTMSVGEQERILGEFRRGQHTILFSCMLTAEGLNIPDCDAVILARPTKSLALYLQQGGRALRRHGRKRPRILDHCLLWKPFGNPHGDRPWTLTAGKAPPEVGLGGSLKACPKCQRVHAANDLRCPQCNYKYPPVIRTRSIPEEIEAELRKFTAAGERAFLARVHAYARKNGCPPGWAEQIARLYVGHRAA